ncbi:hypothetical protein M9H77_02721 [Catharanthus roseus]|uniref:Uncharacterized protein n=1 Tax=Catharanthus roseus TaxID=4058 RepID=A0ACC0C9P8_CATRO|nr:hypothetical protein M9H77_02721 [Catharanthus roseus]
MVKEMTIEKRTLTYHSGVGTTSEETTLRPKRHRAAARNNEPRRGAGGKNNGMIGRKMGSLSQGPQPRKKSPVSPSLNLSALTLTYQKDDRTKTTTSRRSQ